MSNPVIPDVALALTYLLEEAEPSLVGRVGVVNPADAESVVTPGSPFVRLSWLGGPGNGIQAGGVIDIDVHARTRGEALSVAAQVEAALGPGLGGDTPAGWLLLDRVRTGLAPQVVPSDFEQLRRAYASVSVIVRRIAR